MSILGLIKKQTLGGPGDVQTKKIGQITKILKLKFRAKLVNEGLQEGRTVTSKHYVIYIDQTEDQELPMS